MIASLIFAPLAFAMQGTTPPVSSPQDDRLHGCLALARSDSAAAIAQAEGWRAEISAGSKAAPLQCLGTAYANHQMWDQAQAAFAEAATELTARPAPDPRQLSALYAQAGNAALAGGDASTALDRLNAGLAALNGVALSGSAAAAMHVDRARALVALSRDEDAMAALKLAQQSDPQDATAFLLGATLARRTGDLVSAARAIAIADALVSNDEQILLEGGLISAMAGDDQTAASAWRRIVESWPDGEAAARATFYLRQLQEIRAAEPAEGASAGAAAREEAGR